MAIRPINGSSSFCCLRDRDAACRQQGHAHVTFRLDLGTACCSTPRRQHSCDPAARRYPQDLCHDNERQPTSKLRWQVVDMCIVIRLDSKEGWPLLHGLKPPAADRTP